MEKRLGFKPLLDEWLDLRETDCSLFEEEYIMDRKKNFWKSDFAKSSITKEKVTMPEVLLGYSLGPFGALLSSGIFTSILQNYFTDVLKLNLAFLTTLQLVSTIFIIAANLIVGQLIERTKCLAGKARPWILLSAFTLSIASVLMFIVPFEGMMKMVWIAIAYNLFYSVAFPIYNTANATLVPVSTRDSDKRGVLASVANVAGLAVMGAGSMVFPVLVSFALKENQNLWLVTMAAIAIFSVLSIYLQYRFTRERVTEEVMRKNTETGQTHKNASMKCQLKSVLSEKMWWIVILFYIGFQWSGAMKNGSMTYYCKWVLDNTIFGTADAWGVSQSILSIMGAVPMAIAVVLVVPLCNKFGKRLVCMVGMLIGTTGGIIAFWGNGQIIPVAVGVALKCLGSAPACYMILAMLSDVIDHIEYKTSIRTEGLVMSVYSSIMAAGTPICNAIFSSLLGIAGYNQTADVALGVMAQTQGVKNVITLSYIGAETVAYLLCAVLVFFFTIEKNLPQEQEVIAARMRDQKENSK